MNEPVTETETETTVPKTDDAGGVCINKRKSWYVAIIGNRTEKKYAKLIRRLGHEVFVPVQNETRVDRNGSVRTISRTLIAATIFVKCSEDERIDILKHQLARRFMVDHTGIKCNGKYPIATIPDIQMESFRQFVERSDDPIVLTPTPYQLGETVKITDGKFKGLIGKILQYAEGEAHVVIGIGLLGCARLKIDAKLLTRI